MPEISVIMPVYNTQQYLNKSIRSVLDQSYTDFELILVNDGSTDHSLLYCKALAAKDRRVKVLDLPHGGIVAARRAGISAAGGRYIGFTDSDDWAEKDYLKHLHTAITENDGDISMCHAVFEYADGPREVTYCFDNGTYRGDALETLKRTWHYCGNDRSRHFSFAYLWDKLFRRELIMENLSYMADNITRGEDTLLSTACLLDSQCISIVGDVDYHYYMRNGSTIRNVDIGYMKEILPFQRSMTGIFHRKNYGELDYKAETKTIYQLCGISKRYAKNELPPLDSELIELIRAQREEDGCAEWAEAVRKVKEFYLS